MIRRHKIDSAQTPATPIIITSLSCATGSLREIWLNTQRDWFPEFLDGVHLPLVFNEQTQRVEATSDECRLICKSTDDAFWAWEDPSAFVTQSKQALCDFCRDCCDALTQVQLEQKATIPLPHFLLVTFRKRHRGEDKRGAVPHIDAGHYAGCRSEVPFILFSSRKFPPTSIMPRRFAMNVKDSNLTQRQKKEFAADHTITPLADPDRGILLSQAFWAHKSSPTIGDSFLDKLGKEGVLPEPLFRVLWCETPFHKENLYPDEVPVTVKGLQDASRRIGLESKAKRPRLSE